MLQEDFKAGFMSHDELVAALIDKVFETATAFAINDDNSEDLLDSVIDNLVSKVVEQVKKDILCSES